MESGKRSYKSRSDKGGNFKSKSKPGKFQHENRRDDDRLKTGKTFSEFRKNGSKSEDKPERSFASKRFRDDTVKNTDKPVRKISISKFRNEDETTETGSKKIIKVFSKDKPYSKDRSSFRPDRSSYRKERGAAKADDGLVRLNKIIASSGICSRREADDMIKAGLVSVNGVVITELGTKVLPTEDIRYNGERMKKERLVYILLNKPKDYVTTMKDPNAKRTVMELIRGACKERVYPVGRLDRNTTGVLLLTNDGDITKKITHPSSNRKKIYHVHLDTNFKQADFEKITEGFELEDGFIKADEISFVDPVDKKQIGIEIHSGKNHIVRRIFEHLDYKVVKLDRVYFAGLTKKGLQRGEWRFLTNQEIGMLKMGSYK
jgi:23S rRNA pseudouridine2605 synthase